MWIASSVRIDDELKIRPQLRRSRTLVGLAPKLSDAELKSSGARRACADPAGGKSGQLWGLSVRRIVSSFAESGAPSHESGQRFGADAGLLNMGIVSTERSPRRAIQSWRSIHRRASGLSGPSFTKSIRLSPASGRSEESEAEKEPVMYATRSGYGRSARGAVRGAGAGLIVVLLLVWFAIGAIAAGQRHYYSSGAANCAHVGTVIVTVLAGPLNYAGANPKIGNCHTPQPSK